MQHHAHQNDPPGVARNALLGALAIATLALALMSGESKAGSVGPDVTVHHLASTNNYGEVDGIRSYSVGTTSCNVGTEPVWWCDSPSSVCDADQHPVIAQNLYRLKNGRFEQVGMSWLKHGNVTTNSFDRACGACQIPPHGGNQLGVGCTDSSGSALNGLRPMGMRSEVNATSGAFPMPYTVVSSPLSIDQRLQVDDIDVDPSQNAGARYWVEGHHVTADDAQAGNGLNNASYRRVTVSGSRDLNLQGEIVRGVPAIFAWRAEDPTVELALVDLPTVPIERFHVARKVTNAAGLWHYEYAIHNLNADRNAGSFTVELPPGTTISDAGFKDIDHHSGEPWDTTDWTIDIDTVAGTITWHTETHANDPNANAVRWGTMFNFWFDANQPLTSASQSIGLFKPGSPSSINVAFPLASIFEDDFESGNTNAWDTTTP